MISEMSNIVNLFGPDIVYVYPSDPESLLISGVTGYLDDSDIKIIQSVARVDLVCPYFVNNAVVDEVSIVVQALTDECYELFDSRGFVNIVKGDRGDVVFGAKLNELLGKDYEIGQSIQLEGRRYRVKGFASGGGASDFDDTSLFITSDTAKKLFGPYYAMAAVKILDDPAPVVEILENRFRNRDVVILSSSQLAERMSGILTSVETAVLAIGFISVIVAILIIFNSTYSGVMKHMKTIGVFKATGASHIQVLLIFIKQSLILGIIGGILGALVSVVMIYLIEPFTHVLPHSLIIPLEIPLNSLFNSFILAIIISILGSIIPAFRASGIAPAEALRYE
jgi:putative ABC transport system permease protein